ncbi:MAG: class I SAM-dependent methyltransferase [Proteobacteria bacterium]|nr:class I SAM-dependent methyltransferase [Pseudomonadota bacterium]
MLTLLQQTLPKVASAVMRNGASRRHAGQHAFALGNNNMTGEKILTSLDHFAVPSTEHVQPFMAALEQLRAATPYDEWRTLVRASPLIRSWRFFLSMDPYTRWGLVKPRGYPGDATLMDFAYGHESIHAHIEAAGPIASSIYAATFGAKQSRSARERVELLRDEIEVMAARRPITAISVASGHARELEALSESTRTQIVSFTAIDLDPASLEQARKCAGSIAFKPIRRNVVKDELATAGPGDLVYSLGLFDYLVDKHANAVLDKMLALTLPGGKCIVANLAPDAANLGYCEAIMDWWMITRNEEKMLELGSACNAVKDGSFRLEVRRAGCFNYLQLIAA